MTTPSFLREDACTQLNAGYDASAIGRLMLRYRQRHQPNVNANASASGSRKLDLAIKFGTKFVLESKVGTGPTPITLEAESVQCEGCTIENKVITGASKAAFGTGKIRFTGVTVDTPADCKVESVETTPVLIESPSHAPITHARWPRAQAAHANRNGGSARSAGTSRP